MFDSVVNSALEGTIEDDTIINNKTKSKSFKITIVVSVILALILSVLFAYKYVSSLKITDVPDSVSGSVALTSWQNSVKATDNDYLLEVSKDSYLAKEKDYVSTSDFKFAFYKSVMNTVNYRVPEVEQKRANGSTVMVDEKPKMVMSDLMEGESVKLTVIDWNKVVFSKEQIQKYAKEHPKFKNNIVATDSSYAMQELFASMVADHIKSPINGNAPISTIDWTPQLESYTTTDDSGNTVVGKRVSLEEDKAIDNYLFGSKEFLRAQLLFYSTYMDKPIPDEWQRYLDDTEGKVAMPNNYVNTINPNWVGSYRLQKGIVEEGKTAGVEVKPILPAVGTGSKEEPAGLNTSVKTSFIKDDKVLPIRIELTEFKMDQDAIDYFNSKDKRNFGFTTESQRVYASGKIKVTNLSEEEINIKEDTAIVDDQLNETASTGTVYGLKREASIKPGETVELDFWASSTEISDRYLIWGKSFNRKEPAVWFRVLGAEDGKVTPVSTNLNGATTTGTASPSPSSPSSSSSK